MTKTLRKTWLVSLLILILVLSGCAAPTPQATQPAATQPPAQATTAPTAAVDDEVVIAFSGASLLDNFQIQLFEGLKDRADELGVTLIHIENGNDPVKQASDIEDLLVQDIDALLVTAANADAIVPAIDAAVAAGIPVFTIDSASNSDKVLNHSGNDLFCIGYRSIEYLAEQIGGSGKVLHINGVAGMAIVTWNTDGVNAFMAENPDIELVLTGYADWDPARALAITEDVLTNHPDLKGIYVISEVMTGGVIQGLAAQDLTDEIKVMSGGFAPESQAWLANGDIVAAFEWSSFTGAQAQMQRMYDYVVNGTEPPVFSAWPVSARLPDGGTFELDCPIGDWTP